MTREIPEKEWKKFFDQLSHERLDWQTSVEVVNDYTGAQMLSTGLPFAGLTAEQGRGENKIEIMLGDSRINQTHNIVGPRKVYFRHEDGSSRATIEIEDAGRTKTLVNFIRPMPLSVKYVSFEVVPTC